MRELSQTIFEPNELSTWPKKPIVWFQDKTIFISVVFTWDLPKTLSYCKSMKSKGYSIRAGGPAISLMPYYLAKVATIGGRINALELHNSNATFTSRGCIRKCEFCAVPRIEGSLVELKTWKPKPIVCDNNLLACSRNHFDKVIDSLKLLKNVDFNQGLDARLLIKYHAERLSELDLLCVRLAWDDTRMENRLMRAIELLDQVGIPRSKMRIYVLINYNDTPEDAQYRLEKLKDLGILPCPMRYQPLDTLKRDSYVSSNWTNQQLHDIMRYWFRQRWLGHITFEEYLEYQYIDHDIRHRKGSPQPRDLGDF